MPSSIVKCSIGGVSGFKAEGAGGKCHTGPGAREKAAAQVAAINISMGRKEGKSWAKKLPDVTK